MASIFPSKKSQIPTEIAAGLTLAALAIPEVMGYTKIAGTPVITGLYTLLIPSILFAFFGSSRHLVVAADSATAAILAGAIGSMALKGSVEYTALASALALMAACLLILARIIGLGFMADFLSRTVLIGFLSGVGLQVAISQITGMLGIGAINQIAQTNLFDLGLAFFVIAIILTFKKISSKIPGALIAVSVTLILSWIINFKIYGVSILGEIPQGLPPIGLPHIHWTFSLFQQLLPIAFSMFIVIMAQSAATSRAYAARYDEPFNENIDLIGLGLANFGAALSSTFVVNGSPTKTEIVDSAGSRSQLSQLIMSLVVLLVLLFLTNLLSKLPNAVLSAIVFLIGLQLIDIQGMIKIWHQRRPEFWVALITSVVVVDIGVEQGIVIAMVLSLIEHVRRSYRSQNVILALDKTTGSWKLLPVTAAQQVKEGLLIYRFAHTIYYANSQQLYDQVIELLEGANPPLAWFCIDASAVADVDFTAAETLRSIDAVLKKRGVRLVFTNLIDPVRKEFDQYGLTEIIGKDAFYENIADLLKAYP